MSLTTNINQPFSAVSKNSTIQGDNIVFFKGGSTIIGSKWIQFNDIRVDLGNLIDTYISNNTTRLFNTVGGIFYVLITINENSKLEVVPSIAINQTVTGSVKIFSSLSGRLPLILVTLTQDGSNDLNSYLPITSDSYEVYQGYGNFTLRGDQGQTGPQGDTGLIGITGFNGITGLIGYTGSQGYTGFLGLTGPQGLTGVQGLAGVSIPRFTVNAPVHPVANFVGVPDPSVSEMTVQFTNLSTGAWTSLLWIFGDGTTSTDPNPVHTYGAQGSYTVTLYLYSVDYETHITKYNYINISSSLNIQDSVDPSLDTWITVIDPSISPIQNIV